MARSKLRTEFVRKVEQENKKKKPTKTQVDIRGSLYSKRNYRIAIREAALRGVTCILLYKKITTKRLKRFEVIPLSYRTRKLKEGVRKMLFLEDVRVKFQIKHFAMRYIQRAALTERKITPHWPVEIR